ncbi:MAG: division/cell wall cluster transcriptional repressor MraZ [Clostridia bacterium]|nr:division/cell wall cluster transcriptional repressor MraZ [Clostridia bacterium]
MPFVGEFSHTLDTKNRIFIPAKLREELGDHFYITRKMNKTCLAVYSVAEMDHICDQINQFPDSEVSEIKEFLFSKTIYATPDSNGRIVLPQNILDYAKIERNAVIIGAGNHLQIWAEHLWAEQEAQRDMAAIRTKLASLGL